jgi:Arc/MetJ-type ribon-helix-helix transcriptional regulator
VARTQTIVQLSDEILADLDARRARDGRSRSEVIREAIVAYLAADREAAIDRAIIEGYARIPPSDEFAGEWAGRATITAEPWDGPQRREP